MILVVQIATHSEKLRTDQKTVDRLTVWSNWTVLPTPPSLLQSFFEKSLVAKLQERRNGRLK